MQSHGGGADGGRWLGSVAGLVFDSVFSGAAPGVEFGAIIGTPLDPAHESLRVSASNRAFQAIAIVAAVNCFVAALIAWATQPGRRENLR